MIMWRRMGGDTIDTRKGVSGVILAGGTEMLMEISRLCDAER